VLRVRADTGWVLIGRHSSSGRSFQHQRAKPKLRIREPKSDKPYYQLSVRKELAGSPTVFIRLGVASVVNA